MKKISVILILVLCVIGFIYAATVSDPVAQYLLGYVNAATDFSINILESVLPFDLESSEVAYNPNYQTTISGLRIGYYSLISNTKSFALYVTHTPLTLKTQYDSQGTLSEIDYRLYVVTNYNKNEFGSCLSDVAASNPSTAANHVVIDGTEENSIWKNNEMVSIIDQSLYVSLEDNTSGSTTQTVSNLKSGIYESTIYLLLVGGV